jgi:hypothetical protein
MMRSDDNQSHRFEIIDASGGYDKFAIYPGNTGAIVLHSDGAGCVGIGTSAPGYKLDVAGNTRIGTTSTGGNLRLEGKSGVSYETSLRSDLWSGLVFSSNGVNGAVFDVYSKKYGIGTSAPRALWEVNGAIREGSVYYDPHPTKTFTSGFTGYSGNKITFVSACTGQCTSGDYLTVTWAKPSWGSISYDACLAQASGGYRIMGSFYHNGGGGSWGGHVNAILYNNSGHSAPMEVPSTSNQTIAWKFKIASGWHPQIKIEITCGGGSAEIDPDDFTFAWTEI